MRKLMLTMAVLLGIFSLAACGNQTLVKTSAGNITQKDLYNELKSEYGNQAIQSLVYSKLLEKKYTVTQKEIDDKIKSIEDQLGGAAQLQSALQQQGWTMDYFKKNVKTQLLLFKAQTKDVPVNDQVLQAYFDKNKDNYIKVQARHILVDKLSTAQDIEKQLQNGGDFAALAKKYSTDTGSKDKGGELGWVTKGQMVPEFETALFKLKKGEISQPVKSQFGYHIIQAEAIKDSLSDFKDQVKQDYLKAKETDQQTIINNLIKNGNIKINDSQFKDLFKPQAPTPTAPSGSGTGSSSSSSSGK